MKFLHIADVHLGATPDSMMPWAAQREKEIWGSFQNIITKCNEEKVDLLLIAGDLFHRQPLVRELKEVNYIFSKLNTAQVVMMAGNHDFIGARSNYQDFEWNENVHIFMRDIIETITIENLQTQVYGFSYHTRNITDPLYDAVRPEKNGLINILLAHGGDEKGIPINKRKLQDSGFDYIALGHIHKPEIFCNRMAYPGSLEPLDKNEIGERGYILGELTCEESGKVNTTIQFIPASTRQYIRINLPVNQDTTNGSLQDQARDVIRKNGTSNIYSFCITGIRDESIHFDKEAMIELGNVLEIEDQSVPDYDFDGLYAENVDNIIGMFIKQIRDNVEQDEIAKKALYYGMEALLGAKK